MWEAMSETLVDIALCPVSEHFTYVCAGSKGMGVCMFETAERLDGANNLRRKWTFSKETPWQLAACQNGLGIFALASSRGIRVLKSQDRIHLASDCLLPGSTTGTEYTAVTFGENDRTILGGTQTGLLSVFDTRTQRAAGCLRHADSINVIQSIDENSLVVRGLAKVFKHPFPPSLPLFPDFGQDA